MRGRNPGANKSPRLAQGVCAPENNNLWRTEGVGRGAGCEQQRGAQPRAGRRGVTECWLQLERDACVRSARTSYRKPAFARVSSFHLTTYSTLLHAAFDAARTSLILHQATTTEPRPVLQLIGRIYCTTGRTARLHRSSLRLRHPFGRFKHIHNSRQTR